MELREIEIFLVLAEELHFGRTAERMYLSQSRVSQVIRAMETRAGGRLFERTSRQVRLTPLGEQLRDRLRSPYDQINCAFAAVREVAAGIPVSCASACSPSRPEAPRSPRSCAPSGSIIRAARSWCTRRSPANY